MTDSAVIRVVIADDHALVREGTAELLERGGGVRVVGQAADGTEAVRMAQEAGRKYITVASRILAKEAS